MSVLRTKTIEQSIAETDEEGHQLKKRLSALDLTVFGIGVIIGAGIFTVTGKAAAQYAGPAIVISFVIGAVCCGLAALCYAEFASTVPVSGSAYTFSYASLGELVAWIIGWDLLLELMLGASVVSQGWSEYAELFLGKIGITWPASLAPGSHFDLLAFLLVAALTTLIAIGIKESMRVNLVLVGLKLFIVLFVIFAGIGYVKTSNYTPFIPPSVKGQSSSGLGAPLIQLLFGFQPATFGVLGIVAGASIVFFAYIGFDVVATTAEEAKNPQRDLPRGIIASLAICTVLYIAVALVITGMVRYDKIDEKAALASAFASVGKGGFATIIAAGAVAGLTTVVMTLMIGATRVVFAMSRDWLLPKRLARVNHKTGTPLTITIAIGTAVALIASITPIGKLEEMVNIGTLAAFTLVSIAIPLLRKRRPDLKRAFKVPGNPVVPIFAALVCFYLMLNLSVETWLRFLIWMVLGFGVYFFYSRRNSRLEVADQEGVDAMELGETAGDRV
ncbi:amino acid permease [Oryzihumus leptocrescens]|uniref:Amino acid/polyamine/organocation transporter (APC superfamily) n=1 Tax=Oryzihumus leptocrescens TaxID=297536 RepID=A0A542Z9K8_9MICO|nr:amino acid permease [Oryzihumus leptocrescens]TQL57005.1 amino acid/polyamine/organocation transporter (APC superfamily) [Oryzihumus leptocrescens]